VNISNTAPQESRPQKVLPRPTNRAMPGGANRLACAADPAASKGVMRSFPGWIASARFHASLARIGCQSCRGHRRDVEPIPQHCPCDAASAGRPAWPTSPTLIASSSGLRARNSTQCPLRSCSIAEYLAASNICGSTLVVRRQHGLHAVAAVGECRGQQY